MARTLLAGIVELYVHVPDQAAHHAQDGKPGSDRLLGGEAMDMLGPVADLRGWTEHLSADEARWYNDPKVHPEPTHAWDAPDQDHAPPLLVLATWVDDWRGTFGHGAAQNRATIGTEAAYLDRHLHHAAQWHDAFDEFVADLHRVRARIENLLRAGERDERTQTSCTQDGCGARLTRHYGDLATEDHYRCPRCRTHYTQAEFARAQLRHLSSQGADRWVSLADGLAATPRPEFTIRTWIRRGQVASVCEVRTHRMLVWWPDLRHMHRSTEVRTARRSA